MLTAAVIVSTAVSGPHARGPWLGALAGLFYGVMFGSVIVVPRRYERWARRHRQWDAAFLVPLLFFALALLTPLALMWCAVIALAITAVLVLVGRHRRLNQRWAKRFPPPADG